MLVEKGKQPEFEIGKLKPYLPESSRKDLEDLFAYWEKMKKEWEKLKQEFWSKHNRKDFLKLLDYKLKHQWTLLWKYKYMDIIEWLERERFIEEYLHDDILYSWQAIEDLKVDSYNYEDWLKWNVIIKERDILDFEENKIWDKEAEAISHIQLKDGVSLCLWRNRIWDEGAKAISHMKLKDCVWFDLRWNKIWDDGAEALSHMELENGVTLSLSENKIWDKGAEAISHMKLKNGVTLELSRNKIWDEGIKAIMKNMELKENVTLELNNDQISDEMEAELKKREKSYHNRWINCKVLLVEE